MRTLQALAEKLLSEGTVKVVIGYEPHNAGVRPVFVTRPQDAARLVFDARCVHNLARYLSPRKSHVRALGKPAVVVKGCDARAVACLIRENQIRRDEVVLIAVRCGGVVQDPRLAQSLNPETVADRCAGCTCREPALHDHLIGELPPPPPSSTRRAQNLARLEEVSLEERLAFWTGEFARCVRCNACREVCPLCTCTRCVADRSTPQWIESSPHLRGSFAWHFTRALHLAGRCVDCQECERACPAGIPLSLIARKMAGIVERRFDHRPSDDPEQPAPIGTFRKEDPQEFIA